MEFRTGADRIRGINMSYGVNNMITHGKSQSLAVEFPFAKILDYLVLTKPGLLLTVLMTCFTGYVLPVGAEISQNLLHLILGTTLTGAGAHTLNQWAERFQDAQMQRTRSRPLPLGRLRSSEALSFGLQLSLAGLIYLAFFVNQLTFMLGLLTLFLYVGVYTPLKRRTALNTWIGAICGALPPLMGWAAQQGTLQMESLPIFAWLYFWQLPHFLAIGWYCREDYRNAGFRMLSYRDIAGQRTSFQMQLHGVLLLLTSLLVWHFNQAGIFFLAGSVFLGLIFLLGIRKFQQSIAEDQARKVFIQSIIYLPMMMCILLMERLF
ncbi:MAG: heme o synthase [SAR324 cluster bacterium]|nr:heme o synthase [SAR324 cluster bacterium]